MPVAHVPPPLMLYCHEAPASRPPTFTVPSFVMPSKPLEPVSLASARVGALADVSTVITMASDPAGLLFPVMSVWRARTMPAA